MPRLFPPPKLPISNAGFVGKLLLLSCLTCPKAHRVRKEIINIVIALARGWLIPLGLEKLRRPPGPPANEKLSIQEYIRYAVCWKISLRGAHQLRASLYIRSPAETARMRLIIGNNGLLTIIAGGSLGLAFVYALRRVARQVISNAARAKRSTKEIEKIWMQRERVGSINNAHSSNFDNSLRRCSGLARTNKRVEDIASSCTAFDCPARFPPSKISRAELTAIT